MHVTTGATLLSKNELGPSVVVLGDTVTSVSLGLGLGLSESVTPVTPGLGLGEPVTPGLESWSDGVGVMEGIEDAGGPGDDVGEGGSGDGVGVTEGSKPENEVAKVTVDTETCGGAELDTGCDVGGAVVKVAELGVMVGLRGGSVVLNRSGRSSPSPEEGVGGTGVLSGGSTGTIGSSPEPDIAMGKSGVVLGPTVLSGAQWQGQTTQEIVEK